MTTRFPLTDFLNAPFYPGASLPLPGHYREEPLLPFSPADEERFWLLDGHWSRGLTPLCMSAVSDIVWGTQGGADMYQLPATKGTAGRVAGVHVYVGDVPCCSGWEIGDRATRVEALVGAALVDFPALWANREASIVAALDHFESADVAAMDLDAVRVYLAEAWAFHKWVWVVHFELMDPLIGNYMGFRGLCTELGIADVDLARFFQGSPTKIMETDEGLWKLASSARGTAVAGLLAGDSASSDGSITRLRASQDPVVAAWVAELDAFLRVYGWRTDGMCDPSLAPWIEDPTPALDMIAGFARATRDHDFVTSRAAAVAERDATISRIRAGLSDADRARFDGGLAACEKANFSWWQEEHNFLIDLRAHIPLRRGALRIGELVGADRADDICFLFRHEIDLLAAGAAYGPFGELIGPRRRFYEVGRAARAEMPGALGTPPEGSGDPVMKEIFGVDNALIESVRTTAADAMEMTGIGVSAGVVQGRARVVTDVADLMEIEPDEILVCVFTTPSWTPAFAQISGCVADTGGALSHTAIVAREYRVPAVCAAGVATALIYTGDLIELDGTTGLVRILSRA
jgi:phosphohistidine swiveling domain-containing protein